VSKRQQILRKGRSYGVSAVKTVTKAALGSVGYELKRVNTQIRLKDDEGFRADFEPEAIDLIKRVQPYTMTSPERIVALRDSIRYIVQAGIPGAIAECGVWRGGSMAAVAETLKALGDTTRELYLYDTYEGMTKPTERDVDLEGTSAMEDWQKNRFNPFYQLARAGLDEVKAVMAQTGYPAERLHYVQGPVEETLPAQAPQTLALLRLDTDYYESTLHEMVHLYPRLSSRGVLIVDDYGHFVGARQAVDEYLSDKGLSVLLNRIDYSGRLVVKP
jgi:hypothetical protein